jgi:multidrug efflux pump subunit AcrB
VAIQLVEKLKEIEGLDEVEADITKVITRLKIEVDRQKLIESGLSQEQLELMQQEFMLLQMGGTIPGKTITLQGDSISIYIGSVACRTNRYKKPGSQFKNRFSFIRYTWNKLPGLNTWKMPFP